MSGYGQITDHGMIDAALAHVHVTDGGSGERHELGDPSLAAPSLEWLQRAMDLTDPNGLDRLEWISFTSAIKQAGWSLTDPDHLYQMWSAWCARYTANDVGVRILNNGLASATRKSVGRRSKDVCRRCNGRPCQRADTTKPGIIGPTAAARL